MLPSNKVGRRAWRGDGTTHGKLKEQHVHKAERPYAHLAEGIGDSLEERQHGERCGEGSNPKRLN